MQFDARAGQPRQGRQNHTTHRVGPMTDGRTKRGCNRRGDARRSGRERGEGDGVFVEASSGQQQRQRVVGGERGTEQIEIETDKELGLVFRGWGTGTRQAQGERHNLDGSWSCPGGLYASPFCHCTAPPGLWTTDFRPCAHCGVSIQGWAADRRPFLFLKKRRLG